MPYLGRSPGTGVRSRYIYTATASQTAFSGADDNGATLSYMDGTYVDVYMNGVLLKPVTDYAATTKTSIVLTANAAASDLIEIITYDVASIADTVSKANGGTFDANVTIAGNATISDDLTVDTSTLVVDATNNRVGVGNAAPNATLDVNGTIKLDGNYPVGTSNVALGDTALDDASFSGANNVAVGHAAMSATTSGNFNSAVGAYSLSSNTTGSSNASSGSGALENNSIGSSNSAFGAGALTANTTASNNTAVGKDAGGSNSTGENNTFLGKGAGYSSTSSSNTYVGHDAGLLITSGTKNTVLGRHNGNQHGLDIRTSNNQVVISDGDGNPRMYIDSNGANTLMSYSSNLTARNSNSAGTSNAFLTGIYSSTNVVSGGTVSLRLWTNGNIQNTNNSYTALSDQKLKENIVDANPQWDDIKALRVCNYNMIEGQTHRQIGLIAQEVETVSPGLVYETPDKDDDGNDLGTVTKSVNYSVLYMKAVKALQEAMERIETLETANADMLARIEALEAV